MDALTKRELEVLREIASGATNKIISSKLGISEQTAKNHSRHICMKLGASNRAQASYIYAKMRPTDVY